MFVQTEYLEEISTLVATRRPRSPDERPVWAAHFVVLEGVIGSKMQYESDRSRFIGRGKSVMTADAILGHQGLSNTTGTVLDPIFSLRQQVRIPAGKTVRLAFWTVVASSRDELIDVIDKHHDRSAYERDKTLPDPGSGSVAPSWREVRRSGGFSASGRADTLCRPAFPGAA